MFESSTGATPLQRVLGAHALLVVRPAELGEAAAGRAVALLSDVEGACGLSLRDSDLARVNRGAGRWIKTSSLFRTALQSALFGARMTAGLVDPMAGVPRGGHDRGRVGLVVRQTQGLAAVAAPAALAMATWKSVEIRWDGRVRIPAGEILELGATLKAFAADFVAKTLAAELGAQVAIRFDGGVVVAGACVTPGDDLAAPGNEPFGGGPADRPWNVQISESPEQPDIDGHDLAALRGDGERVLLARGAVATAGVARRRTGLDLARLDVPDGAPDDAGQPFWRTVSVLAGSCVEANVASVAAVAMGPEAVGFLAGRRLAARLVYRDGQVLRMGGWPRPVPVSRAG